MALILTILIALSLNAMVDANKVTFTKVTGKIYIETDKKHYAMFGQITDADGVRIVAVNDNTQYQQTSKCLTERSRLNEVKPEHLRSYTEIRENHLRDSRLKKGRREVKTYWSADILDDQKYSASKIGQDYNLVIFIHKDGRITMKNTNCLFLNEKTLVKGIVKMKTDDEPLKNYLKRHPINREQFYTEQEYIQPGKPAKKSWTKLLLPTKFHRSAHD